MNLKQTLLALAGAAVMASAAPAFAQPDKAPDGPRPEARPASFMKKEMPREGKEPRPFAERKANLEKRLATDIELKQKLQRCVTAAADEVALDECMSALKRERPGPGHGPDHAGHIKPPKPDFKPDVKPEVKPAVIR